MLVQSPFHSALAVIPGVGHAREMTNAASLDRPRLDGHVALITGVGRAGQVGATLARAFAEQGASVVLLGRDATELRARVDELGAAGFAVSSHALDLTDVAAVDQVARLVGGVHGGALDTLVNVAGGFVMSGPVAESDPEAWHRQLSINLSTAYTATRAFLPILRKRRGSVVFFASAAALPGGRTAGMSAYAAAKSGIIALARAVADEEREAGVRANVLAPTSIRTAANVSDMGSDARYVELDTIADTVLFLCSSAGRALTGQVIRLG